MVMWSCACFNLFYDSFCDMSLAVVDLLFRPFCLNGCCTGTLLYRTGHLPCDFRLTSGISCCGEHPEYLVKRVLLAGLVVIILGVEHPEVLLGTVVLLAFFCVTPGRSLEVEHC